VILKEPVLVPCANTPSQIWSRAIPVTRPIGMR
jgi:hypothetical protein